MKFLIVLALVAAACARPDVSHLLGQQHHHHHVSSSSSLAATRPPPAILRQVQEHSQAGDYKFDFKTENGIEGAAKAQLKNAGSKDEALVSEGTYSYVGDDGQTYAVNWIADEYGFRASGAHLPVPPPIPAEIQKALEDNANGPEDDGQYHEDPNSYDRPQFQQQQQQQQRRFF